MQDPLSTVQSPQDQLRIGNCEQLSMIFYDSFSYNFVIPQVKMSMAEEIVADGEEEEQHTEEEEEQGEWKGGGTE